MMRSERLMVERRWAMEMVVLLPLSRAVRAELTSVSDSASRADVAVWTRDVSLVLVRAVGRLCLIAYLRRGSVCRGS